MDKFHRWERASGFDDSNALYAGALFFVMNKETGSPHRRCRFSCKILQKGISIGVHGIFGEVRFYRLLNSGILAGLPYKVFYQDGFEISEGYMPDYWIGNEDLVDY